MIKYVDSIVPFVAMFVSAAVVTLLFTPVVREVNRRLGMVDQPDPRRINKLPVPRGGGIAVFLGLFITFWLNALFFDFGFPIAGTAHPRPGDRKTSKKKAHKRIAKELGFSGYRELISGEGDK